MSTPITPYNTSDSKKKQVADMFNNVAETYDFLNHFFSLGIDKIWRKKLVRMMAEFKPEAVLDVATGTGDLAIAISHIRPKKIVGIDISEKMLEVGKTKISNYPMIELTQADSEHIPFDSNTFDAVSVSFGVRNFENVPAGLAEMRRVLKDNGRVYILEFSKPRNWLFKKLYYFYFCNVLPFIGRMVSKDANAYTYLPESVKQFPDGKDFVALMENAGYKEIKCTTLTFGISTIYTAKK